MIKTVEEFQLAYSVENPTKEQVAFLKDLNGRLKSRKSSWNDIFSSDMFPEAKLSVPNLFLYPVLRVHTLWYNHYYHSGLSPFGLASLFDTTPEVIIEVVNKNPPIKWTFCTTTQLPVTYFTGYAAGVGKDLDTFKQWLRNTLRSEHGYYSTTKVHLTSYEELREVWEKTEKAGQPRKFKSPSFSGVVREGTWNNLKRAARLKEGE